MRAAFSEKFEKKIEESTLFKKIAVRIFALSVSVGIVASVAGQRFFRKILGHFPDHSVVPFVLIILASIFIGSICAFSVFYMVILHVKQILHELSNDGPNWEKLESEYMESDIRDLYLAIRKLHGIVSNQSKIFGIAHTASQVAHDIRSPLTALNVVAQHLKDLPEDQRLLIRSAVQRIEDIANDLAGKRRQDERDAEDQNAMKDQLLSSLIEPLISEKRVQLRSKRGIRIESDLSADSYGLFAKIQPVQFKRVVSNLINNSVEALGNEGHVVVSLKALDCHGPDGPRNDSIQITISDNGKGIPQDVLPKLMQKGASFGKENSRESGSGLGLYHARESVESWNGKIEIQSEVGKGTQIIVRLPKAPPPDWFVPEIKVTDEMHIVILDDDNSIHQVWQGRFDAMNFDKNRIYHFTSPQAIISWYGENKNEKASYLFLCDYELLGNKESGLNVIEQLGIGNSSILVTSRFEEEGVKEGCERLGVKLLPKNLAGFVPIILESQDDSRNDAEYILIDDKSIVRKTWEMGAKIANKKVATYSCVDEFMRDADILDKGTSIYIDSDLGEGNRGEVLSEKIYDKGFKKIFLTTGFGKNDFKNIPWITDIVDKDPPFLRR